MITIDSYPIDVALTEQHDFESEITSYPVEDGADVTANVRNMPIVVTLECVVSDTPLGRAAVARAGVQALIEEGLIEPTTPSGDALVKLLDVRNKREPVTITTGLRVYENMVMESLGIPRDVKTGAALRFTATFREVVIVTNLRTRVRVSVPRAAKRKNLGNKSSEVFSGPNQYMCLKDRTVYVKAADVAAAEATASSGTEEVWTDYRAFPILDYDTKVRVCAAKKRIGYTQIKGRGTFVGPDGKTPLSQEELDDYNKQLEKESNLQYGPNMKGPPIDTKSSKYVKFVDRPSPPGNLPLGDSGAPNPVTSTPDPNFKPIKPWWEDGRPPPRGN